MRKIIVALILFLITGSQFSVAYGQFSLPTTIPGNFEGKWYGIHCPYFPKDEAVGVHNGAAFQNQTILDAWGYKAKPIEKIKDLLPEQYYEICTHPELWGNIRINETESVPLEKWPGDHQRLRMEATERNKGKAYLDEKGYIQGYVNGIPFPGSTNPVEIAWNLDKSHNWGEETWIRFYTAVTDKKGHSRYTVTHTNYFWWGGRIHGEHIPDWLPNPNKYDFFNAMLFRLPYDLRGTIALTHRYDDPDIQDDMWMYLPSLRRVRRMSTAQRWDKMPGGQDMTWDAANGFQGRVTNYEWKYLGRKLLLCGRQSLDQLQEIADKPGGGCTDQHYQRVNTIMLQYIPRIVSSVSKAVMYLDPEAYNCYFVEYFDKRGRSYIFHNYGWVVSNSGEISPIGFLVTDVQRVHSSNNYTYDTWQNEAAVSKGVCPSYFEIHGLRKMYGGR